MTAWSGAMSEGGEPARSYVWRKYGEKTVRGGKQTIKRSYYRCMCYHKDTACSAKKLIDRVADADPEAPPLSVLFISRHKRCSERSTLGDDPLGSPPKKGSAAEGGAGRPGAPQGGPGGGEKDSLPWLQAVRPEELAKEMLSDLLLTLQGLEPEGAGPWPSLQAPDEDAEATKPMPQAQPALQPVSSPLQRARLLAVPQTSSRPQSTAGNDAQPLGAHRGHPLGRSKGQGQGQGQDPGGRPLVRAWSHQSAVKHEPADTTHSMGPPRAPLLPRLSASLPAQPPAADTRAQGQTATQRPATTLCPTGLHLIHLASPSFTSDGSCTSCPESLLKLPSSWPAPPSSAPEPHAHGAPPDRPQAAQGATGVAPSPLAPRCVGSIGAVGPGPSQMPGAVPEADLSLRSSPVGASHVRLELVPTDFALSPCLPPSHWPEGARAPEQAHGAHSEGRLGVSGVKGAGGPRGEGREQGQEQGQGGGSEGDLPGMGALPLAPGALQGEDVACFEPLSTEDQAMFASLIEDDLDDPFMAALKEEITRRGDTFGRSSSVP